MNMIHTALGAFTARATGGRRSVLLVYSLLLALAMIGLAALISYDAREHNRTPIDALPLADLFAMIVLGGALFVVAPAMVAANVAEERRHGTLDLLRTAPLSPTALTVGFLAGAPGSLYLLLAGPLALHIGLGLVGAYPVSVLPMSLVLLALGSLVLMLLAALGALALARESGGGAAPMLLAAMLAMGGFISIGVANAPDSASWAFVHPAGALAQLYNSFEGPSRDAALSAWRLERMADPVLARMLIIEPFFATLVYLVAGALLLGAVRRTLSSEPASRLGKYQALGLFSTALFAVLVPMRITIVPDAIDHGNFGALAFVLFAPYCACVVGATPSFRARAARGALGRMSDEASPFWVALLMLAGFAGAIVLAYGGSLGEILSSSRRAIVTIGFGLMALTVPVFSLFSATRVGSAAGRLAFWAMIVVHCLVLTVSIVVVSEGHDPHGLPMQLARLDLVLGLLVPALVVWRQRAGDRQLAAARV